MRVSRPWLGFAGVAVYVVAMAATLTDLVRPIAALEPGLFALFFALCALVLGWRVVTVRRLNHQTRVAWAWIASSAVLLVASNVLFGMPWHTFPAPPDILRLAVTPLLVVGLLRLPMHPAGPRQRLKVALDAGTVLAAACGFLWYLQVGPSITAPGATAARIVAGSLYPLSDLILILGVVAVLLRGADPAVRRPIQAFALASIPWLIGDTALGYLKTHPGSNVVAAWMMPFFITSQFLVAVAAYLQIRDARGGPLVARNRRTRRVSRLPYAAIAAGYGLLFYVAVREDALFPWGGLVVCAFVLTMLVSFRQMVAQHENHQMAVTDALTGLANRVQLHESLGVALGRAGRQGQTTAVLVTDLNFFKQINDTMGHDVGDRLLIAYADMLRRSVMGGDVAARIGGDEFAIVLHNIGSAANAEAVARRILAETAQPVLVGDTPLLVSGSIGIALAGPGEMELDELMRRADLAMYEAKRNKAGTWHVFQPGSDMIGRLVDPARG